ncbi:MAG: hypothetical protein LBN19_02935 [Endomicrobium sp.]|jgi:hypothetical protein|nr:hypothetical protein [Endomicrobium sp.]
MKKLVLSIIFCFVASNLFAIKTKEVYESVEINKMKKYKVNLFGGGSKIIELPDDVKPTQEIMENAYKSGKARDMEYQKGWKGKISKFLDDYPMQSNVGIHSGDKTTNLLMEDTAGGDTISWNVN